MINKDLQINIDHNNLFSQDVIYDMMSFKCFYV